MKNSKNKLLLAVILFFGAATVQAKIEVPILDEFSKFVEMERDHKQEWFDFIKESHDKKIELIKKNHNKRADLAIQGFQTLKTIPSLSDSALQEHFKTQLDNAVNAHEKAAQEWRALCKEHEEKAKQISDKHHRELESFKRGLAR